LLVAIGVNAEGYREILGICEGAKEDKSGWSAFLRHLVDRGLKGVELIISDACRGLVERIGGFLPDARWQRCVVGLLKKPVLRRFTRPPRSLAARRLPTGRDARRSLSTSQAEPEAKQREVRRRAA